jgi:hypothetical protein
MNMNSNLDDTLDSLLDGWREPVVQVDFTQTLLANLPAQEVSVFESSPKIAFFPRVFGPSTTMGAAAAVLLLLVIGLTHTSRMTMENDLVELEGNSDDAMSELYRLIHLEGLAENAELAPEDADMALLLFATGN